MLVTNTSFLSSAAGLFVNIGDISKFVNPKPVTNLMSALAFASNVKNKLYANKLQC